MLRDVPSWANRADEHEPTAFVFIGAQMMHRRAGWDARRRRSAASWSPAPTLVVDGLFALLAGLSWNCDPWLARGERPGASAAVGDACADSVKKGGLGRRRGCDGCYPRSRRPGTAMSSLTFEPMRTRLPIDELRGESSSSRSSTTSSWSGLSERRAGAASGCRVGRRSSSRAAPSRGRRGPARPATTAMKPARRARRRRDGAHGPARGRRRRDSPLPRGERGFRPRRRASAASARCGASSSAVTSWVTPCASGSRW